MDTSAPLATNKGDYFKRYLQFAVAILKQYNGAEPFHLYLKKYFSANKKHGSRDRKLITSLCYNYFRLGFGVTSPIDIFEKLLLAIFIVEKKPSPITGFLKPEWNENIHLDISAKLKLIKNVFNQKTIFPFHDELSDAIDFEKFSLSFLIQPKLFVRIRPGHINAVFDKLKSANIPFEKMNKNCLAFSNTEKVSSVINIDKEAIIQDYNSQRTGNFLTSTVMHSTTHMSVWDCCAASGGKSILANDLLKNIQLTVSDNRKSILENLKARFATAGIKKYYSFVADLSVDNLEPALNKPTVTATSFDLIIADVPCTGSGTWARTPEQLHFFSKKDIEKYASLQQKIVTNAVKSLAEGGYLLYITCSVFKMENEDNVAYFQQNLQLELLESQYFMGYEMQADTLFAALFKL
jgi:16S rRNA (cytosine967-C5)-methyltransferase